VSSIQGTNTLFQGGKEYKNTSRIKREGDQRSIAEEPLRDATSEGQNSNQEASNQRTHQGKEPTQK
jgi:hypothetical protein